MRLVLFEGCSLRGTLWRGSVVGLGFTDLNLALDAASFSLILSASLFILLIFFLSNLALVLSDALVILSFKVLLWDFKLSISASSLLNSLASLESLFRLRFSCLFVKGVSNLGLSLSSIGFQVDICGGGGGGLEGLGGLCGLQASART